MSEVDRDKLAELTQTVRIRDEQNTALRAAKKAEVRQVKRKAQLMDENEQLKTQLLEVINALGKLGDVSFGQPQLQRDTAFVRANDMKLQEVVATWMVGAFLAGNGVNYAEWDVHDESGEYVLLMQKKHAKTPAEVAEGRGNELTALRRGKATGS